MGEEWRKIALLVRTLICMNAQLDMSVNMFHVLDLRKVFCLIGHQIARHIMFVSMVKTLESDIVQATLGLTRA
jgi:hypothetical protein